MNNKTIVFTKILTNSTIINKNKSYNKKQATRKKSCGFKNLINHIVQISFPFRQ